MNFKNTIPGNYYKNQTSPIYPNITVEVIEDGKNQLTLRILNPLDTFEIPHDFPFPYTKSDSTHGEYEYSVNEDGTFFSVSRYDGVLLIINISHLSLLSQMLLFSLCYTLNYIQNYYQKIFLDLEKDVLIHLEFQRENFQFGIMTFGNLILK